MITQDLLPRRLTIPTPPAYPPRPLVAIFEAVVHNLRMPSESTLKRNVLAYFARYYPSAVVRKRHGTVFTTAGDPDVYALIDGHHFELELKRPGEKPTPLQTARLAQWRGAGAIVGCIHTLAELEALLQAAGYPPPGPEPGKAARKKGAA